MIGVAAVVFGADMTLHLLAVSLSFCFSGRKGEVCSSFSPILLLPVPSPFFLLCLLGEEEKVQFFRGRL